MKRVYAYIRVSTVKQGEKGSSLQEQRSAIEGYAARHNLEIVEWFEEKETAAKRGRPIFNKMLRLIGHGRADGVVIHKIDRGARNLRDWADLGELLDRGVEVHFAHESLDLNSRGGRLSADIQAVVAADFIRNLREEVRKGFRGRLKQGLYPLPAPIGYKNEGRGLPKVPDPQTAPLVARAFELYSSGRYNLFSLNGALHRLGLRNRRGGPVTRNGLSTLLNNEFYIGIIHIRRTGERFQGRHEPIISKSLFDRVQMILDGRTKNSGLKYDYLYRKTLRCIHCTYSLIAETQKGFVYYRCHTTSCPPTSLREELVAIQIDNALALIRFAPDELSEFLHEFDGLEEKHFGDKQALVQSATLAITQIDERLGRLTDAYIDRLIDKRLFEERKARLLHERLLAIERRDGVRNGDDPVKVRIDGFLELVETLSVNATEPNQWEKRDLLKKATSNLGVNQKSLVVAWNLPFQVLATRHQLTNDEPHQDGPRTKRAKPFSMRELATTIFNLLKSNNGPSGELGQGVTQ